MADSNQRAKIRAPEKIRIAGCPPPPQRDFKMNVLYKTMDVLDKMDALSKKVDALSEKEDVLDKKIDLLSKVLDLAC
ncbi:hypothetical protein INS49_014101 [Diaporthe citri]|uniref:uncharacterized protein n=1 Tax=Diaporthe citri TaxID=83186 RepID=UPI001C7F169C|nr:uncharacterized protein INS49_014101 [Diaporthe citri]KAG6358217.1 hypothetical protein INS49_014101 [Diaporthe citri]